MQYLRMITLQGIPECGFQSPGQAGGLYDLQMFAVGEQFHYEVVGHEQSQADPQFFRIVFQDLLGGMKR